MHKSRTCGKVSLEHLFVQCLQTFALEVLFYSSPKPKLSSVQHTVLLRAKQTFLHFL